MNETFKIGAKCSICGKFAKFENLLLESFTPDSDRSSEDITYRHINCHDHQFYKTNIKMNKEIFDAFGTKVSIGDWIYYTNPHNDSLLIGKLDYFDEQNQLHLNHVLSDWEIINSKCDQLFFKKCISSKNRIIKCYNQALIETLENLIK